MGVWCVFTIVAFAYFITSKLVNFDPQNKLQHIDNKKLYSALQPYAINMPQGLKNKIMHFYGPNCKCQQYSEKHIKAINNIAAKADFEIINIALTQHDIIPATPSVAITNSIGEVIYFGPYGEGLACSQTSGYAQTVLNNFLKGYADNTIISQAKGCYCPL